MEEPDVFTYPDFRDFLRDWYAYRKEKNPRYSHRMFARRLGSTDPSVLRNLITGHRGLSPARLPEVISVLGLEGEAAHYFALLVDFGQAPAGEERQRAWAAITQFQMERFGPSIDSDQFRYLSKWYFAAVRSLAECATFHPDPAWIADALRPRITVAEATDAIALLLRLGYLVQDGDQLVPAEPSLNTKELVATFGSYGYQRDVHRLAGHVLDRLLEEGVADDTAFMGLTLAVPEHRLAEVRSLLWDAQLKVMNLCDAWPEPNECAVQVSIQMFPVSVTRSSLDADALSTDPPESPGGD